MERFSLNNEAHLSGFESSGESYDLDVSSVANPFSPKPPQTERVEAQTPHLNSKDKTFEVIRGLNVYPQRSMRTGKLEDHTFEPIGMGGEHVVVEFPTHRVGDAQRRRSVVKKINFRKTLPVLRAHFKGLEERKRAVEAMEDEILDRRKKLQELREYFGVSAVPSERFVIDDVPVSRELVHQVFPNVLKDDQKLPETLPAWSSIQRHIELPPDKTVSLTGYYPEVPVEKSHVHSSWFKKMYDTGHDILVGRKTDISDKDEQRHAVLELYPGLSGIEERVESDPVFKEKLKETVRNLIRYLSEVGVALDLAGRNNIVLIKSDKGWQLKMPDPLPLNDWMLESVSKASDFLSRSEKLPATVDLGAVFNALNTIRVTNALAVISGIRERLYSSTLQKVPAPKWRELFGFGDISRDKTVS